MYRTQHSLEYIGLFNFLKSQRKIIIAEIQLIYTIILILYDLKQTVNKEKHRIPLCKAKTGRFHFENDRFPLLRTPKAGVFIFF